MELVENLPDFQSWAEANHTNFTIFDYLHGNIATNEVPADVIAAVIKLTCPDFIEREEMCFLADQFSKSKFEELKKNRSNREVEYWMNLLSIGSLFGSLSENVVKELISNLKESWHAKLANQFPNKTFCVDFVEDDGDLMIYFTQEAVAETTL